MKMNLKFKKAMLLGLILMTGSSQAGFSDFWQKLTTGQKISTGVAISALAIAGIAYVCNKYNKCVEANKAAAGSTESETNIAPKTTAKKTNLVINPDNGIINETGTIGSFTFHAYGDPNDRGYMEDMHCVINDEKNNCQFFAVFDGHATNSNKLNLSNQHKVCLYLKEHLYKNISNQACFSTDTQKAITDGCLQTDNEILEMLSEEEKGLILGSTATFVLIKDGMIYIANIGDSRTVLSSKSGNVKFATTDHSPNNGLEQKRILSCNGEIEKVLPEDPKSWKVFDPQLTNKVANSLGTTRAFGNYALKQRNIVIANPEINTMKLTEDLEYLVLTCDGIWDDVKTNERAIEIVRASTESNKANQLVLRSKTSRDNLIALVVKLN